MADSSAPVRYVASTYRRIFAHWLDQIAIGVAYAPALLQMLFSFLRSRTFEVELRWLLAGWLLAFFYRLCFTFFMGGTIGKLVMGLRVVSKNGELKFMQALLRSLTDELSWFFGLAPRALMLLRLDRTHISDWVAETQVVQFTERLKPAQRRKILGPLLIVLLALAAFSSAYKELRSLRFEDGLVIFDANS